SAARFSSSTSRRPPRTSLAPSLAKSFAVARPIPALAPAMIATLFCKRPMIVSPIGKRFGKRLGSSPFPRPGSAACRCEEYGHPVAFGLVCKFWFWFPEYPNDETRRHRHFRRRGRGGIAERGRPAAQSREIGGERPARGVGEEPGSQPASPHHPEADPD